MSAKSVKQYEVLRKPRVTEKSSSLGSSKIVFEVDVRACKQSIKSSIESIFDVKVSSINTSNYLGKVKRVGRSMGRTKKYKKAVVTLQPGYNISLVEGI